MFRRQVLASSGGGIVLRLDSRATQSFIASGASDESSTRSHSRAVTDRTKVFKVRDEQERASRGIALVARKRLSSRMFGGNVFAGGLIGSAE